MTLLELMAALAVLSILMALAVTGFQAIIRNQRVSAAERSLQLAAQEARQRARLTRNPVRLAQTTTTENGVSVPAMRWERLDCANAATDTWGSQCPIPACLTNACGAGGCTCSEVGEPVPLSPELDVTALEGLCWLGDSGRPVARAGTTTCDPAGAAPAAGSLKILRTRQADTAQLTSRVLAVDALTGTVSMTDCEQYPAATGCAP